MKAHIVQKAINNSKLEPFLQRAQVAGAKLICFGELAGTGCLYESREVPSLDHWIELFSEYDLHVMVGLPLAQEGKLYNSYLYFHRGTVQVYQKINLFTPMNETNVFTPGTKPGIFKTDFGLIGVAICYDIRFNELFDNLKAGGAEMIFVPAAFPLVRIDAWKSLLSEHAVRLGLPVIGINTVGDDGMNEFGGNSMLVDSEGQIVALADDKTETVLELEL